MILAIINLLFDYNAAINNGSNRVMSSLAVTNGTAVSDQQFESAFTTNMAIAILASVCTQQWLQHHIYPLISDIIIVCDVTYDSYCHHYIIY
jgi:hypothetical protein